MYCSSKEESGLISLVRGDETCNMFSARNNLVVSLLEGMKGHFQQCKCLVFFSFAE